ncbi:MAG: murein biosynthesis integral membrane protein MurJ, partial [Chloroflexi bacterium]|nr:murein biosynthesis integral membrane protein MurJ [Chloroflexota bacterium]
MEETERAELGSLAKNSAIISVLSVVSIITGFGLDMLIAARFGLSYKTDAFFVAWAVPTFIMNSTVMASNRVFVPLFSHSVLGFGRAHADKLVSILLNYSVLIMAAISVLGASGSAVIVKAVAPSYTGAQYLLATQLSALLFLSVFPIGAMSVLRAALNERNRFTVPAAALSIQNVVALALAAATAGSWGIKSVAIGYAAGSVLQALVLFLALRSMEFRYSPSLDFRHEGVAESWRLLSSPLAGAALGQGTDIFQRFLASFLPVGSVAALGYASRVHSSFLTVLSDNVTTALMPSLSRSAGRKEFEKLKERLAWGVRLVLASTVPISAGVAVLAVPMVQLLFGRGRFNQQDTFLVGSLLALYALSWPLNGLIRIFTAPFLAWKDSLTPFIRTAIVAVLRVALSLPLLYWLGVNGLVSAWLASSAIGAMICYTALHGKLGRIGGGLSGHVWRLGAGTASMAVVTWLSAQASSHIFVTSSLLDALLRVVLPAILGALSLIALGLLLGISEIKWLRLQ